MATKHYRCIVRELNIRSQPQTGSQFKTGQVLHRHDLIAVDDQQRVDAQGYAWVRHSGGWCAERTLDGRFIFLTDGVQPREHLLGMNIDPNNPKGNPPPDRLTGVGWVRFVFHVDSRRETLEQAFTFYDPTIRAYARAGTRIILILLQDTYLGNMPWVRGDWASYARGFAERAGMIARRYRGQIAAYQIWNEGDVRDAETSHYIPPAGYAGLMLAAVRAITESDPSARVISGGLASDLEHAVQYLREVRSHTDGILPVDGIGVHPYGQVPPGEGVSPFSNWAAGSLEHYLNRFAEVFPGMPLWITEIGVPRVPVGDQSLWPRIANYMEKTIAFVRTNYCHLVPALVWFAWSDAMDRAGIVSETQRPKGEIFATFFGQLHASYPPFVRRSATPFDGKVAFSHVVGESLPDRTIEDLARRLATEAPNVGVLLLKGSRGVRWLSGGAPGMTITWSGDMTRWADALARYRIRLAAWHEVEGSNLTGERALIGQLSRAPGVESIVLDLNPAALVLKQGHAIREFMVQLRHELPAGYPLGLSFDGRPETFQAVSLQEWYPFIESWHPKIFHLSFGGGQGPVPYLTALFKALRPYRKPIVPMLQAAPPQQVRDGVRLATDSYGSPGISFGMLSAIRPEDFGTIRGISIPWLAGMIPAPNLGTLTVFASPWLHIRAAPSTDAESLGRLQTNDRIAVLERQTLGVIAWVRHRLGWSAARNTSTGEIYLG